jgi:plasmid stability protein
MNEKVTVELDETTMAALSRQATAHGRSPAEEVEDIVRRDCAPSVDRDVFLRRAREAVQADAGKPFDRESFLRRARELALKSRTGGSRRVFTSGADRGEG